MRAGRLLSTLLLLQAKGRRTARQIADELEVSVRTVYRDIAALQASGVPVLGDPGHDGGYHLPDGFRTKLTGLTTDEAGALFLTGLPEPAAALGLGGLAAATTLKLMAALPDPMREQATRVRDRFHVDTPDWYGTADDTPHLAAIARAVWEERRIAVRYRRWASPREVDRELDPYGLVLKGGHWYLVGADRGEMRTYRVSRVLSMSPTGTGFQRSADFDLAAHWREYLGEFDARRVHGEVTVRLSPTGMEMLTDLFDGNSVRAVADTGVAGADGWVTARIPYESVEYTTTLVLRFGEDAELLEPGWMRERLAATVRAIAEKYA
ncbi:YafY family protein [Phytomonospora sp. NPDC050363]|uniref:helix-turn-helix transcriptional regulator n=1 Tax=Phytomonospora sp. NPDC050363 TaxID=3155642 RepID=UPI00340C7232